MKLSSVLANIKGPDSEKTASLSDSNDTTKTAASPSTTGDKLKQALKEATADPAPMEKQAEEGSPVGDLMKTASQIVNAEHEALVKEAHLYGSAVADGFLARVAQHTDAIETVQSTETTKTAGQNDSFEKFASENPDIVKEAAELGYASTMGQMEKLAEASYEQGYNGAVETIYKLANDSFVKGFEDTAQILNTLKS
jgi:hypothetical protein